ncbi:hypothetical protein IYY11_12570 [Methylocystis sp. H62]|uniref:hypothetical protein n=1 Tax=Methylocystis sp. H62 TaxID=2785789 RepID=UPI0018C2D1F4|nr:hypothetical protein [Methylocystis sp. H62]MBG0794198.1 hypothetical protein [Methylocystis sp. H62]
MSQITSFRLRYVGARFSGKRLPVDVLVDLPAFRELLVAFAKAEWRKLHEDRKRVPKGFDASLAFDLVAVEDGSAVPVLEWNRETTQSRLPGFTDQIEDVLLSSFDGVVKLFDEAAVGQFPAAMAPEQIRALNKFGANLRDKERIEFEGRTNARGEVIYLSSDVRKRLIGSLRDRYDSQIADVGMLLGSVSNPEGDLGHIRVRSDSHGAFDIPIDNETIKLEFDGNIDQPIELNLTVQLDNEDRVKGVIDVHSISLIDEQIAAQVKRCKDRLSQVAALQDGWHDGEGSAPSIEAVRSANWFLVLRVALCEYYRIYPTDEGGILFELEVKGWDLSVEFLSDGKVKIYGIEISGDHVIDEIIFDGVDDAFLSRFNELTK